MSFARELIRNKLRTEAKQKGLKPSKYIKYNFDRHQIKKHGLIKRRKNQAKGTHERKTWPMRIATALDGIVKTKEA